MICPQCNSSKIAVVDNKHTCIHCGTVLADVTDDDHVIQINDRNDERQRVHPEGRQSSRDVKEETRREKEFLNRIGQFSSVLGVSAWTHDIQRLYYTYRSALLTYRGRFSTEATVSLIFIGTRVQRPGSTLSDYGSIIGITDVRALNSSFKRLSNIMKASRITTSSSSSSSSSIIDLIPSPTRNVSINDTEARISTVIKKLFDPISIIFNIPETRTTDLKYWTERVYAIAVQAELQTGRHMDPLIAACVVVGASVIGQNKTIRIKDWKLLGKYISYGYTTIQTRHTEVLNIIKRFAKKIPWLSHITMTKLNLSNYLSEIIELGANNSSVTEEQRGQETQQTISVERYPPTYLRNQAFIQQRARQIETAFKYFAELSSSTTTETHVLSSELLSMDPEIRMIYLLLAKNVPASEIEEMGSHRIYEQVHRLYLQEAPRLSVEELNSSELTEKDMNDAELAQYMKK